MAPEKKVTQEDLVRLELRQNESRTVERHEVKQSLQRCFNEVDDVQTDVALLKQSLGTMESNIEKINVTLEKILGKLEDLPGKFVTKDEHQENRHRIEKLETKVESFNVKVAGWSGGIVVLIFIGQQAFEKLWK